MSPTKSEVVPESPRFKELCESLTKETRKFTFACGGSVPIVSQLPVATDSEVSANQETQEEPESPVRGGNVRYGEYIDPAAENFDGPPTRSTLCLPVDLRWDSQDKTKLSQQTKITFPLTPETEGNISGLVEECEAATFGRGNEDVLDESYRKAKKMDPTQFSSSFNPYELGIVDTIAQTLLPTLRHAQQTRSVKAELYKLNFYSAPSGMFKAHVDTPRSSDQFGSLVVSLPLSHKGGALEVRHQGKTVTFDWSSPTDTTEAPSIKWAAFYSDCEHEVLEVTEGHRLTLTYNLYIVRGNGFLGGHASALDPTTLPLYNTIRDMVNDSELWKEEGYIGYHCAHIYPHTSKSKLHFMAPDNLKGADMAIYSICCSLGLNVTFRPAFEEDDLGHYHYDEDTGECDDLVLGGGGQLKHVEWFGAEYGVNEDFDKWVGRKIKKDEEETSEEETSQEGDIERLPAYVRYKDVHWVNKFGGNKEQQGEYMAYGNQHSIGHMYSCLTMIIEVPRLE